MSGGNARSRLLALVAFALILASIALLPDRAAAASGWQIVLDRPTPNFGPVDFVSDTEGWMPAGAGLLHTTDGGATWSENAKLTVSDVDFFDQQHGWAVGPEAAIFHTTNGGETWEQQESGLNASMYFVDVVALGPSEAWAIAVEDQSDTPHFPIASALLHTTDGGLTWLPVELPDNAWFSGIEFVGSSGWLLGTSCDPNCALFQDTMHRVLLRTTDGGATWSPSDTVPDGAVNIDVVDEAHAWIASTTCDGEDCSLGINTYEIHRTVDGGQTWSSTDVTGLGGLPVLSFGDRLRGWGVSAECDQLDDNCTRSVISTEDGGVSWRAISTMPGSRFEHDRAINAENDALYLTSNYRTALRSTDGGVTWGDMSTPALTLTAVDFVDRETGFAFDDDNFLRSDDAGRSWQSLGVEFPPFITEGTSPAKFGFFSKTRGVVAYEECGYECRLLIALTTDGGSSWSEVGDFPSGDILPVMKVDIGAAGAAMVLGANGFLFTSDYGSNWRIHDIRDGLAGSITDADLVDANHIWATVVSSGSDGAPASRLVESRDGGASWTVLAEERGHYFGAIRFVDDRHGWYAGGQKCTDGCPEVLYSSTDGGVSWQAVQSGISFWPDLVFVDAVNGWAIGRECSLSCYAPRVTHTADGGRTWTTQYQSNDDFPANLDMVDAQTGWFTTASSCSFGLGCGLLPNRTVLYHTTDGGGGPIGEPPLEFPDVGYGPGGASGSPWLPALLAATGLAALAASFALCRARAG